MAEVTVGTTGAEKAGTESAAAKSVSPEPGGNGSAKETGKDARFAELTGEIGRKDTVIEKLREENKALKEKSKTDEDKRIEQLATERFGPDLARKTALESWLSTERDALLKQIPPEHAGLVLVGDHIPVEQQIAQARSVLALLTKGSTAPAFSGGGNPASEQKRTYTMADYTKWSNSIYTDRAYYDKHRDEMIAATKEGRVEGMR